MVIGNEEEIDRQTRETKKLTAMNEEDKEERGRKNPQKQ